MQDKRWKAQRSICSDGEVFIVKDMRSDGQNYFGPYETMKAAKAIATLRNEEEEKARAAYENAPAEAEAVIAAE